ncbi:27339_t:CDS:2, partial [Dentiscutata erythropus]
MYPGGAGFEDRAQLKKLLAGFHKDRFQRLSPAGVIGVYPGGIGY